MINLIVPVATNTEADAGTDTFKRMTPALSKRMIENWSRVVSPVGWTGYTLPFVIETNGERFRVRPDFDLRNHAAITVAKEYYVDTVNGNDANAGTRNAPLLTWNAAAGKADVDRIVLMDGAYCYRTLSTTEPTRAIEVIGEGTVYLTSDHRNICSDWALESGNVYKTTLSGGNFVSVVLDEAVTDANGNPTRYASAASVVACQADPGSYYWTGGTLYVHPVDSRALSGNPLNDDLWLLDSLARALTIDSKNFYFHNVNFRGGVRLRNNSSTGGLKTYFDDCTFHGGNLTVAGVDEIIFRDCEGLNAPGDGVNYDLRNTKITKFAEIDCIFGDCGSTTSDQASTCHNGCVGVRINGTYRNPAGQCIADVLGCYSWLLGCLAKDSAIEIGYNCSTTSGYMWLDGCTSEGNSSYDVQVGAACQILYKNLTSGGNFDATGTLGTYF